MDRNFLVIFVTFAVIFVLTTRDVWQKNTRFAFFRKSKEDKITEIKAENEKRLRWMDEWTRKQKAQRQGELDKAFMTFGTISFYT